MSRLVLLALVAALGLSSPARANDEHTPPEREAKNAFVVSLGWATATFPLVDLSHRPMQGPSGEVGWRRALWTRGALDVRVQWRALNFWASGFDRQHQVALAARVGQQFFEIAPTLWLGGAVSAGYGLWTGCISGDDCGSYGPTLGAGLSLETDALSGWAVEFGVDSQFGLINRVEYGLLPMARVSLAL